jgi:outer membrane protein assembly factor BamD
MLKKWAKILFVLIASMLITTSCSNYQRLLKSTDYKQKYEAGIKYYEEEEFYKAKTLFEELIPILRGTDKAEKIYYYYAYCHYNLGDHVLAGYYFNKFSFTFPNSIHLEEAQYMSAYCQYLNSPGPELDQKYTYMALNEFQLFINKYPESSYKEKCNEYMDKLRQKLETKAYISSKLYYNLGDYKAAVVVLNSTLNEFPDSDYREELMFLAVKSNYKLAENSINKKKKERYQGTVDSCYEFIDEFSNSKKLKEAQRYFDESVEKLNNK